ncbi:hypothetical protein GCM10020218_018480 [Dactylosporangium vinaceum]|uniref:Exonuclease domain-containing protein n=1 Tax=Dactylosporangium vinaceum TaxID=53362 RepID=A0ABV5MQW1_9ACTN|nr:hypothetical protein [Dactylosporangium vinaceum]
MDNVTIESWLTRPWRAAPLVAVDLEGAGAQDRDNEAILEVAAIRLVDGVPDTTTAYTTLVNPGRPVPQRPWISPGLTDQMLAEAPPLSQISQPGSTAGSWSDTMWASTGGCCTAAAQRSRPQRSWTPRS